jgi:hypothetical protein
MGDGHAVVVGETLPDRGGGDRGVRLDHRVDVAVQAAASPPVITRTQERANRTDKASERAVFIAKERT